MTETHDPINHPKHYTSHPSGVECIRVTEHMSFNVGNAMKYLWRADEKGAPLDDLKKARWYVNREIARRGGGDSLGCPSISPDGFCCCLGGENHGRFHVATDGRRLCASWTDPE